MTQILQLLYSSDEILWHLIPDEAPQQMSLVWSMALEDDITDFAPCS